MKTEIFASYKAFLSRNDTSVNGVSPDFAKKNPDFENDNSTNMGCWNCKSCKWCASCVSCDSCESCRLCKSCVSCDSCESCRLCKSCESCDSCKSCVSLRFERKNQSELNVPLVQNIHQSVFNAASAENALDMGSWHTCDTTHCRAGWVVHLAGKAGYELEKLTSSSFAAMAIYNKSSDIKVPLHMFYVYNAESLADMKRCSELEAAGSMI